MVNNMNQFVKQLQQRRSVKRYRDELPDLNIIEEIAKAGANAPSALNRQPAIIIVITNKEMIKKIENINRTIANRTYDQFYNAPVLMCVLCYANVSTRVYDGSLVMGNLINAANAYGLGACWIHRAKETFETSEGKQILHDLGIEGNYEGIGNCIMGYIDGDYPNEIPRKNESPRVKTRGILFKRCNYCLNSCICL